MAVKRLPVSRRALIQRINRLLSKQDERLCVARPDSRLESNVGTYYVINVYRNAVASVRVDLEGLGRRLKALKDWEVLSE
jgi:hypothetical protein